jgi:hypothetical protein
MIDSGRAGGRGGGASGGFSPRSPHLKSRSVSARLCSPSTWRSTADSGLGVAAAMVMTLADSPPHYIERWRQGAQGEKATAKAVRGLVAQGWVLANDIDIGRGNIDHILVGPPGAFLLESKNLHGLLAVRRGVLSVRWREDPHDGYENHRLSGRMETLARTFETLLEREGVAGIPVQPVVVLWGNFEQRAVQSRAGVAWVRGNALAGVLASRPAQLSNEQVQRTALLLS